MDRLIYTVLNSIQTGQTRQAISANNLANMNVPGFRKDLPVTDRVVGLQSADSFETRFFQTERETAAFSTQEGFIDTTGDPFDVAIRGEGYFFVTGPGGEPGLTRRGDFRTDATGQLINGAGEIVLNAQMQSVTLPPHKSLQISEVGQILIEPLDAVNGETVEIGLIATVRPGADIVLHKDKDGLIRPVNGPMPLPDQQATLGQGMLEGSNINSTEELIRSIELQRQFERNVKMIAAAKELDEAGAALMRPPD